MRTPTADGNNKATGRPTYVRNFPGALPLQPRYEPMKRDRNIKLRVTEDEYHALIARAGRTRGVASFIRDRLFKGAHSEHIANERPRVLLLARVHANLVLIARAIQERNLVEQIEIISHLVALERAIEGRKREEER